jgi:hypothetical protein
VDDEPQAAQRALPFDSGNEVVGHLHDLLRAPEHELARVDHEGLVLVDLDELGQVVGRRSEVDRGHAEVVEDAERAAQAQVDRGRLNHRWIPRLDPDPALVDEAADRAVGEHRGGHRGGSLRLMLARLHVHGAHARR